VCHVVVELEADEAELAADEEGCSFAVRKVWVFCFALGGEEFISARERGYVLSVAKSDWFAPVHIVDVQGVFEAFGQDLAWEAQDGWQWR
jgi:hypothetical protein